MQGVVKWFKADKGFGFIESDGKDYFVHFSDITGKGFKTINAGDKVSFEVGEGPKGACAKVVTVVNG